MSSDSFQSDPKISATILPGILSIAHRLGVDIQSILQHLGISVNLEMITQTTIEMKQLRYIFDEVEKASGRPAIGLLIGEEFEFEYLPHLKALLMSASTFREAFEVVRPTQELISPLLNQELEENEKEIIIRLKPHAALSQEDDRRRAEMVFSFHKTINNRLMRKTLPPKAVHFCHNRSELAPLYADFFGCAIVLNAPENAIIYKNGTMDSLLPSGSPDIRKQALNIVHRQQADSPLYGGLVQDIKRVLTTQDSTLNAPIEKVARALHMSTRTLQRRLSENRQSLAEIRDQVRFQLAVEALRLKRSSIEEIGERLGFSDRHSFTRAFKRWCGLTPSTYRKKIS